MSETQRDEHGRFLRGCRGGPGNPGIRQLAEWRRALAEAVTPADIRAIVEMVVGKAKGGNMAAAIEILNRCCGRPTDSDVAAELEQLAQTVEEIRREYSR